MEKVLREEVRTVSTKLKLLQRSSADFNIYGSAFSGFLDKDANSYQGNLNFANSQGCKNHTVEMRSSHLFICPGRSGTLVAKEYAEKLCSCNVHEVLTFKQCAIQNYC